MLEKKHSSGKVYSIQVKVLVVFRVTWTFAEFYKIFGVKWDFCRTDFSTRTFAEVMIGTFAELQNSRMYCKTKINVGIYIKFI